MAERFGVTNPRALALRFHAQTGGSTLTAQQPENNIVRVAIQALSAVCGGAQSLHTNSFDEALALPSERAATIALRTQQVLANEVGRRSSTADPLGGSYFVEALTDELEARALGADRRASTSSAARSRRSRPAGCRARSRPSAYAWTSDGRGGRAHDRRRQRLRRGGARSGSSCTGSTPNRSSAPARADARASGPSANAAEAERALAAVARGRTRHREPAAAAARGARRALHGRRDLRRPARGVGRARPEATRDLGRPHLGDAGQVLPPQPSRRGAARRRRRRSGTGCSSSSAPRASGSAARGRRGRSSCRPTTIAGAEMLDDDLPRWCRGECERRRDGRGARVRDRQAPAGATGSSPGRGTSCCRSSAAAACGWRGSSRSARRWSSR